MLAVLKPAADLVDQVPAFAAAVQAFLAGPCSATASLEGLLEQYPVAKQLRPQHCYAIIRGCLSRFGTVPTLQDLPGMQQLDAMPLADLMGHAVSARDWKGVQTLSALPAAAELPPVALRAVLVTLCSMSERSTETFVTLLSLPPAQDIPRSALMDLFLSAAIGRHWPYILTLQDMLPEAAQLSSLSSFSLQQVHTMHRVLMKNCCGSFCSTLKHSSSRLVWLVTLLWRLQVLERAETWC